MFIIDLHYIKPLKDIDEKMGAHVQYLNKYYASGNFIVSGRKNPRTGGIIIATGKTKKSIELIIKKDPFYKHHLAAFTITEFNASQRAQGLDEFINDAVD